MKSNREYDYFGNVLEYEYDYFPSYSSTSTQKVLVHEYDYSISDLYLILRCSFGPNPGNNTICAFRFISLYQ